MSPDAPIISMYTRKGWGEGGNLHLPTSINDFTPHFGAPLFQPRRELHFQTLDFFSRRAGVPNSL